MGFKRYCGFTLVELMVVVVIMAIISGVFLPKLLSSIDEEDAVEKTQFPIGGQESAPLPSGALPIINSAKIDMELNSAYHRVGMEVFTRYEVKCTGRLELRRAVQDKNPVCLVFPLPEGKAEARDVRLTLTRASDNFTFIPDNLAYHNQKLYWSGDIPDNEHYMAEVSYVALGRDQFEVRPPLARQLRSIDLRLKLTGAQLPEIPDYALQPTSINDQFLTWNFNNLVTDRSIVLEIPAAMSPLGRVILLVKLVAVAVLLFGFGFWYLTKPGQLKDFRWGHFLLLALTYSLFFVIFAIISFHGVMDTWFAMGLSAALSLPMLLFHVSRVLNLTFAIGRALPLAVFTLGLVINGVYGGPMRDYLFIGAIVFAVGFFTLTHSGWSEAHGSYKKQKQEENEKRIQALRISFFKETTELVDQLQAYGIEAKHLLCFSTRIGLEAEKNKLNSALSQIKGFRERFKTLKERLPDLNSITYHYDLEWVEGLEKDIKNFKEEAGQALTALKDHIEALKEKKQELRNLDQAQKVYCSSCGAPGPHSPHCQECGAPRCRELSCPQCDSRLTLPLHVAVKEKQPIPLYCPNCGEKQVHDL